MNYILKEFLEFSGRASILSGLLSMMIEVFGSKLNYNIIFSIFSIIGVIWVYLPFTNKDKEKTHQ